MKRLLFVIVLVYMFKIGTAQNNQSSINQIGNQHSAFIEQAGNDNEVEIKQTFNENWVEAIQMNNNNKVFIDQIYGSKNIAQIGQMGDQQHTFFRQQGNQNVFRLWQENGHNQVGESASNPFVQNGNANVFAGVEYNLNGLNFVSNDYAMQLNGAVLHSSSYQTGNQNQIGLYQNGESIGSIQQYGDDNSALLYQLGNSHNASIIQTGNGNAIKVIQSDF